MPGESKIDDPKLKQEAAAEAIAEASKDSATAPKVESEDDEEQNDAPESSNSAATGAASKKKKSKRKRVKAALTGKSSEEPSKDDISKAVNGLSKSQIAELLQMNPALARELGLADGNATDAKMAAAVKKLDLEDIMTGLAASGKNVKDMASYKFWQTQPVPKFDEKSDSIEEGPFKIIDPAQVPKEPGPLVDGFEWVTMDLTKEEELKEVFELLYGHYVEDDEAMFRFNYSTSFLRW
jgi:glycylpeptide N-tetradecanoyltransferase